MLYTLTIHFLELVAAFSGFYFLKINKNSKLRPLVYYLVITVCVDALGSYTLFIDKIEFLRPLKTTLFRVNFWLFNIYIICSLLFFILLFRRVLKNKNDKTALLVLLGFSVVVVIYSLWNAGFAFFENYIEYNFVWTTFSIFICVSLYFREVLKSDKILVFYKSTMFYVSIGLLFWWLVMPPVIFYMPYYKEIYPNLVNVRDVILILSNLFLYGCFTIGFLWGKEY